MNINFDELLIKLRNLNIVQKSYDWQVDLPEDIWKEYFIKSEGPIEYGLDINFSHTCEISTQVYKFENRYLGIRSITSILDDITEPEDIHHTIEFFEMEPIQITSYAKKEEK
jgi:hypothetical protein